MNLSSRTLRRRRGLIAAAAAGALITGGVAATPASAFIGDPGTGTAPVTDAPDLVSVSVAPNNSIGPSGQERLEFCFDEALNGPGNADAFYAFTYDSARFYRGTSTTFDPTTGAKCVVVSFRAAVSFNTQGSVGAVTAGAVTNTGSIDNYYSSAPIGGSTLTGRATDSSGDAVNLTTGPDLIKVVPDSTNNTVSYFFDQAVDPDPAHVDGSGFAIVDDSGQETWGLSSAPILHPGSVGPDPVVSAPTSAEGDTEVRVQFPAGTLVGNKIRYSVAAGAVQTPAADGLSSGTASVVAAGDVTPAPAGVISLGDGTRPVLTRVTRSGTQFTLTYSKPSGPVNGTRIAAVLDDGYVEYADSAPFVNNTNNQSVTVSFAPNTPVTLEPTSVVRIVSETGAASDPTSGSPAPVSAANVGSGSSVKPGYTDGPDLLTTTLDPGTDQATFNYDEAIDPAYYASLAPGAAASLFYLVIGNGTPEGGTAFGEALDDHVKITYGNDFTAGVGVANVFATAVDKLGNPSVFGSVGTEIVRPLAPPTLVDDPASVAVGHSTTVGVLANDTTNGSATITVGTLPSGISATVTADHKVNVSVASTYSGAGSVSIPYTVTDAGGTATGHIVLTITGRATAPRAGADSAAIAPGASSSIDVLINDTFSGVPTLAITSTPPGITATVTSDQKVTVSVAASYAGTSPATVAYSLTDAGGRATGHIAITIPLAAAPPGGPGQGTAPPVAPGSATCTADMNKVHSLKAKIKKAKKKHQNASVKKLKKKLKRAKQAAKSAC